MLLSTNERVFKTDSKKIDWKKISDIDIGTYIMCGIVFNIINWSFVNHFFYESPMS